MWNKYTIIVIAAVYSQHVSIGYLLYSAAFMLMLIIGNFSGIRNMTFYLIGGALIWFMLENSGIHGVISGVLIALCIPARPAKGPKTFINKTNKLIKYFEKRKEKIPKVVADEEQHLIIEEMRDTAKQATTPLQRLESMLDMPISLVVLPLFAFFNAGIVLNTSSIHTSLQSHLTWGIALGLFVGKPLGIALFTVLALKLRIGLLPKETNLKQLIGVFILGGIGFTMSLFMNNLAFTNSTTLIEQAKFGILLGSVLSAIAGVIWLCFCMRQD